MRIVLIGMVLVAAGCGSAAPMSSPSPAPTSSPTAAPTATAEDAAPWIAYEWWGSRNHKEVTLIHPDGSDVHQLATDIEPGSDHAVVDWSPDGKTIAFSAGDWYVDTKIWTVDVDGSNVKMLLGPTDECRLGVNFPAYSPDGSRLLYVCDDGLVGDDANTTESLMILDLASGASTKVATFTLPDELLVPRWSPDGKSAVVELAQWVVDGTEVKNVGGEVAVVAIADGTVTRLTESDSWAGAPDWSVGNVITYGTYSLMSTKDMTKPSAIYTVKPDGLGLTQIPTAENDGTQRVTAPRWTPDGSHLIVSVALGHGQDAEDVKLAFMELDGTLTFIPAGDETRSGVGGRLQP